MTSTVRNKIIISNDGATEMSFVPVGLTGEVEDIRRSLLVAYEQKGRLKDDVAAAHAEKSRLQMLVEVRTLCLIREFILLFPDHALCPQEGRLELARLHGEHVEASGLVSIFSPYNIRPSYQNIRSNTLLSLASLGKKWPQHEPRMLVWQRIRRHNLLKVQY